MSKAKVFAVHSKVHADMLYELLSKAGAVGSDARPLADLYHEAQRIKAAFDAEAKPAKKAGAVKPSAP